MKQELTDILNFTSILWTRGPRGGAQISVNFIMFPTPQLDWDIVKCTYLGLFFFQA